MRQRRERVNAEVAIVEQRAPLFAGFKKKCLCGVELCTTIRMHHPRGNETKRLTVKMGEVVVKRHLRAMGFEPSKVNAVWEQIQQGADMRIAVCVHYHGGDFDATQRLKAQTTNPRAFARQRRTGMLAPLPCRAIEHNGDGDTDGGESTGPLESESGSDDDSTASENEHGEGAM